MGRLSIPEADNLIGKYFPVLDHGFVALVDYMGGDLAVERAARNSYSIGPEVRDIKDTRRLIRYLVRHNHTSPFEMAVLTFHIAMPIFVARQWVRNRTCRMNEYSGRYSEMPTLFHTPEHEDVRTQAKHNKQMSADIVHINTYDGFKLANQISRESVVDNYDWYLEQGIARETARIDLPLSTYTYMHWQMDLNNLFKMIRMRSDDAHAQRQIVKYSDAVAGIAKAFAPLCFEAFEDYQFNSVTFSRREMELLRENFKNFRDLDGELVDRVIESSSERREFLAKLDEKPTKQFGVDIDIAKPAKFFMDQIEGAKP